MSATPEEEASARALGDRVAQALKARRNRGARMPTLGGGAPPATTRRKAPWCGVHPELGVLLFDPRVQVGLTDDRVRLFIVSSWRAATFERSVVRQGLRQCNAPEQAAFGNQIEAYRSALAGRRRAYCGRCGRQLDAVNFSFCTFSGSVTCDCGACTCGCIGSGWGRKLDYLRLSASSSNACEPAQEAPAVAPVKPRTARQGRFRHPEDNTSRSYVYQFAKANRKAMTPSERRLEEILGRIDGGALKGRFEAQHVFLGPWILDFFFPEVRLAIEVDGSIHLKPEQKERDRLKDADCARWDMTLLRVTNEEVSGDEDVLVRKLREAWAVATRRENKIIGKVVHQKGRVVEMATGELPDPPDRSQ